MYVRSHMVRAEPHSLHSDRSVMKATSRASLAFALTSGGLTLAAPPTGTTSQLSFDRVDAVVGSPTTAIQARDLNGDGRPTPDR